MALLDKNGKYIKADLENYKVHDVMLYVRIKTYKDEQSRLFEKENAREIESFKQNVLTKLQNYRLELNNEFKKRGIDCEIKDSLLLYQILQDNQELKIIYDKLKELEGNYYAALDSMSGKIPEFDAVAVIDYGFQIYWTENPIEIESETEINLGPVPSCTIDASYIYQQLKNRLPGTVDY